MSQTKHIVMFSGGIGSWAAAKRVAERHGTKDLTLLFTDVLMEDSDLYRFLIEAAADIFQVSDESLSLKAAAMPEFHEDRAARFATIDNLAAEAQRAIPGLEWTGDGRDPWTVFRHERMLGNSGKDPCSRVLKREVADRWLRANCNPLSTTIYVGIDWTETHRFDDGEGGGAKNRYARNGWLCEAPMTEAPYQTKADMLRALAKSWVKPPRLYGLGAAHNNCGGFCVKAGQGHFAWLLRTMPYRYRFHEEQEEAIRRHLEKDVSMMSDRSGGDGKKPLTMKALRERIERGNQVDMFEIGGCGCFIDDDKEAA